MAVNPPNLLNTQALLGGLAQLTSSGRPRTISDLLAAIRPELTAAGNAGRPEPTLRTSLTGLLDRASSLNTAARALDTGRFDNVFQARVVTSTNRAAVTAVAEDRAAFGSFTVSVSQLAAAQVNRGSALTPNAASAIGAGTNTVAITIGGETRSISFDVQEGDTNETALNRMAQAINDAAAGVRARVARNAGDGTLRLTLTAANTGTDAAFTIADVTGNAVAAAGVGAATSAARNAIFTVDGEERTSQSNDVDLANGVVTVSLRQTTTEDVTLTVGNDSNAIVRAVGALLDELNQFDEFLRENASLLRPNIGRTVEDAFNANRDALARIGIVRDETGRFTLNEEQLRTAINEDLGRVQNALNGVNGLADAARTQSERVLTTPLTSFARDAGLDNSAQQLRGYLLSQLRSELSAGLLQGLIINTRA